MKKKNHIKEVKRLLQLEESFVIRGKDLDTGLPTEKWLLPNGLAHREHGPAIIDYNRDGTVTCKKYLQHGKYHRDDGPAVIFYNAAEEVIRCMWYLDNNFYGSNDDENSPPREYQDAGN